MIRRLAAPLTVAAALAVALAVVTLLSASRPAAGLEDPVLVAAGDIASCNSEGDEATANLVDNIDGTVAVLGDNVYDKGTSTEFQECYDPSWGRFKARTKPSVGNHEYETPGASGYYEYFGAAAGDPQKGYYSYDLGSWHVVVLNSNRNCAEVSCAAGSPQEQWLRNDLATHSNACTLAYWHHPRFSSSSGGGSPAVAPFWQALYDAGAEVVLNGHRHNYERFAPQDPGGKADPEGIREFIVGTGGKSLNAFVTTEPNSDVRLNTYNGVIKLTLHPNSYDWQFVTTSDVPVRDSGSGTCDGGTTPPPTDDTTPPTVKSTVPAAGATGVSPTTDVTATFSEAMDASTINGTTFKLRKKGSTKNLPVDSISYNPTTLTATLDPTGSLERRTTYKAIVTTGAEDLAGNRLDQKATTDGLQQKGWTFTTN